MQPYFKPHLFHAVMYFEPHISHAVTYFEPRISHAVTYFEPHISHATPCWLQNHANIIFDNIFQTKNLFLTIVNDFLCTFKKDFEEKKFSRGGTFKSSSSNIQNLLKLVVYLLVELQCVLVHIIDPDVVGPLEVVLDKTNHTTSPLVPAVTVSWAFTLVHLHGNIQTFFLRLLASPNT